MMREFAEMLTAAIRGPQRRPTVILLSSTVLMVSWWYFGSPRFYLDHIAGGGGGQSAAAGAVYTFASCFLLLGVIPALIIKLGFRQSLTPYGVGMGDRSGTLRTILILGPLFVAGGWISAPLLPSRRTIRSTLPRATRRAFAAHMFWYLLFYLGWEFHFRGFLQFGLRDSLGATNALLVQVLASSLLHFGKPGAETFAAILGGILWGAIAYRTRSLLSGLGQHYLLGISLDFFLCRR